MPTYLFECAYLAAQCVPLRSALLRYLYPTFMLSDTRDYTRYLEHLLESKGSL